jgi:hypothetical protein
MSQSLPPAKRVPIENIKPNPDNPRVIKDDKFKKLVASIREFPDMLALRPIVVNADRVVLGGNMRLKACQAAGLKEVPVIVADHLTPDQQREFIIKDNVGFGEWDWDELANAWDAQQLTDWGVDVPWNAAEIAMPEIADVDSANIEQMTFTLTTDQADLLREALDVAKAAGPFINTGNANSNGNAISRIAEIAIGTLR